MATLYVTEPGVQVHKRGQRLLVMRGNDILEDIPLIKVDRLVLVGRGVGLTTPALYALTHKQVDVMFLNSRGSYISRLVGREHKNSRLRHAQSLAVADSERAEGVARDIVRGKIHNQRVLVQRHAEGASWARRALDTMDQMLKGLESARSLDEIRGHEGLAARAYFEIFRSLLKPPRDGKSWGFDKREYYPPPDPINALLSFGYTLLLNQLITSCQTAGLDPDLGFFHAVDFGKPSMALDLEEEFRPIIADSLVLAVINRPLLSLSDFEEGVPHRGAEEDDEPAAPPPNARPIYLTEAARNRYLALFETRLNEMVYYPGLGEQTTYRRVLEQQAYAMARTVMGETSRYQPFIVR
jgi:CRISPR-associated protein Cas1